MAQGGELRRVSSHRSTYPDEVLSLCNLIKLELCCLGGLSSADWSVRRLGGGGLMPTTDDTAAAHADIPSSGVTPRRSRQRRVLENRDLCRIVGSYIPKPLYFT